MVKTWRKRTRKAGRAREQPERRGSGTRITESDNETDRIREKREAKELENFWAYCGDPQPKIDEILLKT